MALNLRDCEFAGPAMPEPFVLFKLEDHLNRRSLLPKSSGTDGRVLQEKWEVYRRQLRALSNGGKRTVFSHVLEPIAALANYQECIAQEEVRTREGDEEGGWLFQIEGNSDKLRVFSVDYGTDLDAPHRRGRAYRFSPMRTAQRVLSANRERLGLLTDGLELRLLFCDPSRSDSHISIRLDRSSGWAASRDVPDSFRLLLALASPQGVAAIPDLVEEARLAQTGITRELRKQARRAVETFIQAVLDNSSNEDRRGQFDVYEVPKLLWREGLVLVYRLLFILKLESATDPARAFSFASTSQWRNSFSPSRVLADLCEKKKRGSDTGGLLEQSLRALFRLFLDGLSSSEMRVAPLGGMLFGAESMPLLESLKWGDTAVSRLLENLLWTESWERVHYGTLDVEDLGRIYESLLELEPGIASEPMCRLRRAKLEVVVPLEQGTAYRRQLVTAEEEDSEEDPEEEEDESPRRAKGTKVLWVEEIPAGHFYLRVGLGRKASGSYYTPHPFVRFLVQETLRPQVEERSPKENPNPVSLLGLKVLDPAMGSGHFLVEACRFLGDALYEACRLCDEKALELEEKAEEAKDAKKRKAFLDEAAAWRKHVEDLPDPNNELLALNCLP